MSEKNSSDGFLHSRPPNNNFLNPGNIFGSCGEIEKNLLTHQLLSLFKKKNMFPLEMKSKSPVGK